MDSGEPFPFLVGVERSGTTLVRAMFDAHPDLAIPQESHFIAEFARERDRYETPEGFEADALVADLTAHERFRRWGVPAEDIRRALAGAQDSSYVGAVRAIYAEWARREGKPRYGDKTPAYLIELPLLAALFPEARFVHLIRDGRDVALSFADSFSRPLFRAFRRWRLRVTTGRSAGRALGSRRYQEIRYEDLLHEPEVELRRLCRFLDLSFDGGMLRHHEQAEPLLARMPDRHHHERVALPVTCGLRDWRSDMSPGEAGLCEQLGGDLLSDLGYELSGARPSLRARSQLARMDMASRARRVSRRGPR